MASTETAWDEELLRNPHAVADKRSRVKQMFAAIAPSYDLNNRLHSLWQDQRWRRKAVKIAELKSADKVVDVACGTGDLTIEFLRGFHRIDWLPVNTDYDDQIVGIDFTFEMLPIARQKSVIGNRQSAIAYLNGDAQALPL